MKNRRIGSNVTSSIKNGERRLGVVLGGLIVGSILIVLGAALGHTTVSLVGIGVCVLSWLAGLLTWSDE